MGARHRKDAGNNRRRRAAPGVHRSATILLFELVAGAVSSQWLTDEVVTTLEWFGGGLIILAAYLAARQAED